MDYPKLRNIDIFPYPHDGRQYFFLMDPLKISDKQLSISQAGYFLLSFFDGKHSLLDIQYEYTRAFGELLMTKELEDLIEKLDSALFLDGERFQQELERIRQQFKDTPVREAFLSGTSYDSDPDRLMKEIDLLFERAKADSEAAHPPANAEICGIIAPHIDLGRGGLCYAHAYWHLRRAINNKTAPITVVIFGVAHQPMNAYFSVCSKNFSTPLGELETDRDFVRAIENLCNFNIFEDEFLHRAEHSIEFQTVLLKYIASDSSRIKIVPVLCGSYYQLIEGGRDPSTVPEISNFIEAVKDYAAKSSRRIYMIGGVDLAHYGQKFGDTVTMGPAAIESVRQADSLILEAIEEMDAAAFYRLVQADKDKWKICGLPAIYAMLKAIDADAATVIKYDRDVDRATESLVSFAAAVCYRS